MSAGTVGEINVRIGGDNDPLKRSLKDSEHLVGKFDDRMASLKGAFAGIVVGVGAQQVISFLSDSVKMAGEAELALSKLQSVLKATGNAAGYTAEELSKYATHLQSATTFDDDGIINMMAVLGTFRNISGETFREATALALDMSTVLGSDLQSSAIQLGKALNEPVQGVSALSRVGIQFTEAQKEVIKSLVETGRVAEAQRIILDEVAGQMGGSATAAARTYAGQMKQLQNEYDNLREDIGQTIVEIMAQTGALDGARSAIRSVAAVIEANRGQISLLGDTFREVGKAVGWAGAQINAFMSVWNSPAMQAAMGAARGMANSGPIGIVSGGVDGYNSAMKAQERAKRLDADGSGLSPIQQAIASLKAGGSVGKFQPAAYPSGGGGGSSSGSGGGSRTSAVEDLRDSLKTELELEQERYEKGMALAAGDAELREALAADHAEKMKELSGVTAWEQEIESLKDKFKTESELERERYATQMEQLQGFLDVKAVTLEEYQAMEAEATDLHQQLLTEITDKEAAKRAALEQRYQDQINAMRASSINLAVGLLNQYASKSKAAAIAAVLLSKGLMIAQTRQSTAAAKMRAMAELGPIAGPPAAEAIGVMGAVQVGLIAATGIADIASAASGGGSGVSSSSGVSTRSSSSGSSSSLTTQSGTLIVEGINESDLFTGQMVKALAEKLLAYQKDGGKVIFATA